MTVPPGVHDEQLSPGGLRFGGHEHSPIEKLFGDTAWVLKPGPRAPDQRF